MKLFALLTLVFSLSAESTQAQTDQLPPALQDWQDWVLYEQEFRRCPVLLGLTPGVKAHHICAWPGRLDIALTADGGRFEMAWQALEESWVPLPGGDPTWPLEVAVDGNAVPVIKSASGPLLRLSPGEHRVQGHFRWQRTPEFMQIPSVIGLLEVRIDGQPIHHLSRQGNRLWLGQERTAESTPVNDSAYAVVERKLSDGVPLRLTTLIALEVSGRSREVLLGQVLPTGFVPTEIDSPLPLRIDAEQRATLQVRAGTWRIRVEARALTHKPQVQLSAPQGLWPAQEIWSFAPAPRLRVVEVEGLAAVDPRQSLRLGDWYDLPTYTIGPDTILQLTERSRGMAADEGNQLHLNRRMWLDFSGEGHSLRDSISGRMFRHWRLDMRAPAHMTAAEYDGQPQLISQGLDSELAGVEVRQAQLNIDIDGRLNADGGRLPVAGYDQTLQSVTTELNLPPGYRLIAALDADRVQGSWVEQWQLLDLFLLLITAAIYWRLFSPWIGLTVAAYLLLGYHEHGAPIWSLLLVAVCVGTLPLLSGWPRRILIGLRNLALLALALLTVPFIADQLRAAIYPQLERSGAYLDAYPASPSRPQSEFAMEELAVDTLSAPAPLRQRLSKLPASAESDDASLEPLQRYSPGELVQTGQGRPSWRWHRYQLSWSGPVTSAQTTRLIIAQPWQVRSLRVVLVAVLLLILSQIARSVFTGGRLRRLLFSAWLAALSIANAGADEIPPEPLLDELRQRLLPIPACSPTCGVLEQAVITVDADQLTFELVAHAAADVALPLPRSDSRWQWHQLQLNGQVRQWLYRDANGVIWLRLDPGLNRITLSSPLPAADRFSIEFVEPPQWITLSLDGWEAAGVNNHRLSGAGIELTRARQTDSQATAELSTEPVAVPTFVELRRNLILDLDWTVQTRVHRVAPSVGSVNVSLPLWPQEAVTTNEFGQVEGDLIRLSFPPDRRTLSWQSRLEPVSQLILTAGDQDHAVESWTFQISPIWHFTFEGMLPSTPHIDEPGWRLEYHPRRGEQLTLNIHRPAAVEGPSVAVDHATLTTTVGQRSAHTTLVLDIRASQAQQHTLHLPAEAHVDAVIVHGQEQQNLRNQEGLLRLPLAPGQQQVEVRWQEDIAVGLINRSPMVDLNAAVANIELRMHLPNNRWIWLTDGPRLGPAVLYWGELLVMLLVALALGRSRQTPLRFHHWLLLGIGFSTLSWAAYLLLIIWLFVMAWRQRRTSRDPAWQFNLLQLGLVALSVTALLTLLAAIPYGLLAKPDMHMVSYAPGSALQWFDDRSAGPLPQTMVVSLPLWWYKAAMLAWALWLSNALLHWLPWVWHCLSSGGLWRGPVRTSPQLDDNSA